MAGGAARVGTSGRGVRRYACVAILGAAFAQLSVASAPAADPVIAAAGDIACSSSSSNYNGGNGTADRCRQKYTSNLLVDAGLSAVLILGDMQYESASLSGINSSYHPTWGRVKSITRPAAGNHEYKTSGAAGYFDYFNGAGAATGPAGDRTKGYYSFNVGTWHLIALNSTDHCTIIPCSAGSAQEVWLKADLAANADKYCTLAYWHDPRFNSGHDGNADEMKPLFQALYDANADVVLGGHAHSYERFAPQNPSGALDNARGLRQFVVGTGGAFWTSISTPKPNSEVRQNNTYGVLKMTLKPTGYDYQFVPEAGKTWTDAGSGTCHGGTPPAPDTIKPSIPGNLRATAGTGQVSLLWNQSTDNVGVTGYQVFRGTTQIATVGSTATSYTDANLSPGTYSYTVRATDAAGNISDPSNSASATPMAGSAVFTFSPEGDARVEASTASTNYATSFLRVDGSSGAPSVESLLRFNVAGTPAGGIASAKLRVYAYSGTADGPAVFTTNPAWNETAVNWSSRPPGTSATTDDKGTIPTNSWVEYDVTSFVTGNGAYSFGLTGTSTDGVDIYSREAATLRPELVVTTSALDTTKPTPPGNLTATGSAGQVALGWQGSTDNVGVTGYRVFRGTTQIASLGAAARSHADTGLAAGPYSYTVRAVDAAGNLSDPSNTASANVPDTTKPTPPGNLTATGSAGQVALGWQGSTDNVGVTGYRVFRGTAQIASLGAAARSHADTGLAAGPYSYTVHAVDAAGNLSDPSNTASANVPDTTKPTPPGNLSVSSTTSSSANLSWQASTDNVGVAGYRVFRDGNLVGSPGATATSYSDTSVSAAVTYRYVVRAIDAAGNLSDPSNEAPVTVPDTVKPTPPGNLRTTAVTSSRVDFSWNQATDNVGVTGYRVFRGAVPIANVSATTTSYSDGPIAPGTYHYTVRAVDAAGNLSDPSNQVTAEVLDTEDPTAPGNLDATAQGAFQVDLTWEESTDNVGVVAYLIYRDDVQIDSVDGTTTSYTDNVLPPATYTYHVLAVDDAGNLSDPSNADTVTMLVPDDELPTVPGSLTAALNGSDQVDLSWDESTDNVGVTAYRVYRNDALIATVSPASSYSDTDVPARDHEYRVRAEDAAGNLSDPSNPAGVIVPDAEAPSPPGSLAASAVDGGPVQLTWEAASDNLGVAGYEVFRDGLLVDTIEPATSYTDPVGPGSYAYYVKALDATGNVSDESTTANVTVLTVDTEKPGPPANLQAQAGSGEVDLTWDAASDNRAVTGYEIRRDGGLVATIGAVTAWTDNNVAAPHTYEYELRALDAAGNVSDPSNIASATMLDTQKPSAPANLRATATASQVDLAWDASGDNVAVTGYKVYRDGALSATLGAVTTYSDTSVTAPGHDYEVRAFDAAGNLSDASNRTTATVPDGQKPTPPGNLRATAAGPNQVNLAWDAAGDNIGVTGYRVFRDATQIATIGAVTTFSDTGVAGSTTYAYEVRAVDAAGNVSDASGSASATTPAASATFTFSPEADARVQASATTTNYATSNLRVDGGTNPAVESLLRFTVSGAPAGSIRSAKLRVYAYSGTVDGPAVFTTNPAWNETAVNWNNRPPRTSVTTDDKGAVATNSWVEYDVTSFVTSNGTYSFGLAGTSSDGADFRSREAATDRPVLIVTTGAPDTQKPTPPPSGLAATVMSASRVDLSWQAAGDNVGVTGYRVFRNGTQIASLGVTTAYSDTTVSANSSYNYEVRAVDAAGNISDPSNSVPATTPAAATVLTLSPEADARVQEANATTNYGTAYLRSNGGSESDVESFLRFTVTGAPAGTVQSAKLRLYAYNGTADGPAVYTTGTSWSETAVNWNTRPARTSVATADKGAIPVNTWVEYDVTSFVTGNGTYSFNLATTSNDGIDFYNREAATLRPELVVTLR